MTRDPVHNRKKAKVRAGVWMTFTTMFIREKAVMGPTMASTPTRVARGE